MAGFDPGSVSPSGAVYQALNNTKGNVIAVFDVPMIDEAKHVYPALCFLADHRQIEHRDDVAFGVVERLIHGPAR